MDNLMSLEDLSTALQVPRGTLYQWRHKGQGPPAIRIGRHLRYRPSDVARWLDERAVSSNERQT